MLAHGFQINLQITVSSVWEKGISTSCVNLVLKLRGLYDHALIINIGQLAK